jgi:omega-6 fatty acid desaturase (delta-12 desaturase)
LVLPPLVFLLLYRVPFDTPRSWRRERRSVLFTNLALAVMLTALVALMGWRAVLLVQLFAIVPAAIAGVWLFAVQHRFEKVQWMRQSHWTAIGASIEGSSYLKLPPILQWFTGNIGFHHVHHLLPRVPNYRLQACHEVLQGRTEAIRELSFTDAMRAPSFALWDEAHHRMVPFPP